VSPFLALGALLETVGLGGPFLTIAGFGIEAMVAAAKWFAALPHATLLVASAPAIATALPSLAGFTVLIDAGANIDPKPRHLFQFAVMGHVYSRDIIGKDNPRVGLLSVGEEEGKGNELVREVFKRLEESPINFIGNVEGRDVYNGSADVVVTDGFTGNVVLKVSESLADMLIHLLREEINRSRATKLAALLVRPAFRRLWKRVDYTETGGAPLLGINGACIIGHGASPARAVKNAIRAAAELVKADVNGHIRAALAGELAQSLAEARRGRADEGPTEPNAPRRY